MRPWIKRFMLPLAVLPLLLAVGSCEPVPTAPDTTQVVAPQTHAEADHEGVVDQDGNEYDVVVGDAPAGTQLITAKLIDSLGGTLSVAGHRVTVPAGAVLEPTLFTIRVLDDGYVEVELTATLIQKIWRFLLGTISKVIDVGSLGFEKPVTVEISYAYASNVADPTKLVLLRMQDDDPNHEKPHELIPSEVDTQKQVVRAQLDHFTKYCLASN